MGYTGIYHPEYTSGCLGGPLLANSETGKEAGKQAEVLANSEAGKGSSRELPQCASLSLSHTRVYTTMRYIPPLTHPGIHHPEVHPSLTHPGIHHPEVHISHPDIPP